MVELDWNKINPFSNNPRLKKIEHNWGILQTVALYEKASLLIGIDSGPYHLASMTRLPALGVFLDISPWSVSLPRAKNRVLCRKNDSAEHLRKWNGTTYEGQTPRAEEIVKAALVNTA